MCEFFIIVIHKKNRFYFPPRPSNIDDRKHQITTAVNLMDRDIMIRLCEKFSYRIYVARAAGSGHTEHFYDAE